MSIGHANSPDGSVALVQYGFRLQQAARALDGVIQAKDDNFADHYLGKRQKGANSKHNAEALLNLLFACRFARDRRKPNLERPFSFLRDSPIPRPLAASVAECQRPAWSSAVLRRLQISVDAVLALVFADEVTDEHNDVSTVIWGDSSVQNRPNWFLSTVDYCKGIDLADVFSAKTDLMSASNRLEELLADVNSVDLPALQDTLQTRAECAFIVESRVLRYHHIPVAVSGNEYLEAKDRALSLMPCSLTHGQPQRLRLTAGVALVGVQAVVQSWPFLDQREDQLHQICLRGLADNVMTPQTILAGVSHFMMMVAIMTQCCRMHLHVLG